MPICIVLFKNWTKIVVLMCGRAVFYKQKNSYDKGFILTVLRNYPHAQDLYKSWSFMFKRYRVETIKNFTT